MAESFEIIGDKGYRGYEYVKVCERREEKSTRQVVESALSQIKAFNNFSRWRNLITMLAYLCGYSIGYSFFRKSMLWR